MQGQTLAPLQNASSLSTLEQLNRQIHLLEIQKSQEQQRVASTTILQPQELHTSTPLGPHLHPQQYLYAPSPTPAYQQQVPVLGVYGAQSGSPPGQYPTGPTANDMVYYQQHLQALSQERSLPSTPVSSPYQAQPYLASGITSLIDVQTPITPQSFLAVPSYNGTPSSSPISVSPVPSVASSGEGIGPTLQIAQPLGTMVSPHGTPAVANLGTHMVVLPNYALSTTASPQAQPTVMAPFTLAVTPATALQAPEVPQSDQSSEKLAGVINEKKGGWRIFRMSKKIFNRKKDKIISH